MAPRLNGVLESALYVDDLERGRSFYRDVLGLAELFADPRMCAFDAGNRTILLLFLRGATLKTVELPGGTIPPHDGHGPLHLAFAIAREELADWEARLAAQGIPIEGRTDWPRGGHSIYFRDPAGHLVELATPGLWTTY